MFQSLNEFKFVAETGKSYIIYFLKFWQADNDYIIKYLIRAPDRDYFWFGRISKERALKGFEEPDTEFVFYKEPFVARRIWKEK